MRLSMILSVAAVAMTLPLATTLAQGVDWTRRVTVSPMGGHVVGNPAAATKLIEYLSYTCVHCAAFTKEATGPLRLGWVKTGNTSVEVRNAVRDRFDLTAALLARCGGKDRFFGNHGALFDYHDTWMTQLKAYDPAKAKVRQWSVKQSAAYQSALTVSMRKYLTDPATKYEEQAKNMTGQMPVLQQIARDTGLYPLMQKRGFTPVQLDACIADPVALTRILAMTDEAWGKVKIRGTPGFTLNGKIVEEAHDWDSLRPALPAPAR